MSEPDIATLDHRTISAIKDEVSQALDRGWTLENLRGWFASQGVTPGAGTASVKGVPIDRPSRDALARISVLGIPMTFDAATPARAVAPISKPVFTGFVPRTPQRPDARLVADALSLRMADLISHFRGHPNPAMSDRLRTAWGRKGSLVLHLAGRRAGRWDDYQAGTGGDGLDLVQHEQGGSLGNALEWAAAWLGGSFTTAPATARPRLEAVPADDSTKIERARRLWSESVDPRATLVIHYLKNRGLDLPDDMAGRVIRFHPACPWKAETGDVIRVPAMVSAMVDIDTNEVLGVHRTALNPDGSKIGKRMTGRAFGTAIKLDDDAEVSVGLSVGEGIETCLAARQLGFRPAWALGSSGAIARFPVLSGVDGLTLLAETDDSGANEKATTACAERWDSAGRQVMIVTPRLTGDMNDVLQAMRGAA